MLKMFLDLWLTDLQVNSMVTTVRLPNNNIPDEGVEALIACIAGRPTVSELDISGNRMGPKGCKALVDMLDRYLVLKRA